MTFAQIALITLTAGIVSFGAHAQSANSNDEQHHNAGPVPEATAPSMAKRTAADKKATVSDAQKSGAGSNSAQPNGASPIPEAKTSKPEKRMARDNKTVVTDSEKSGAGSDSSKPNGAAPPNAK